MNQTPRPAFSTLREAATRIGHDAVWLMIAGLFCVVEAAVFVTEVLPLRSMRRVPLEVTHRRI